MAGFPSQNDKTSDLLVHHQNPHATAADKPIVVGGHRCGLTPHALHITAVGIVH
jgi:hypothetical protein